MFRIVIIEDTRTTCSLVCHIIMHLLVANIGVLVTSLFMKMESYTNAQVNHTVSWDASNPKLSSLTGEQPTRAGYVYVRSTHYIWQWFRIQKSFEVLLKDFAIKPKFTTTICLLAWGFKNKPQVNSPTSIQRIHQVLQSMFNTKNLPNQVVFLLLILSEKYYLLLLGSARIIQEHRHWSYSITVSVRMWHAIQYERILNKLEGSFNSQTATKLCSTTTTRQGQLLVERK